MTEDKWDELYLKISDNRKKETEVLMQRLSENDEGGWLLSNDLFKALTEKENKMTEEKLYAKCDQCGEIVPAQALMVIKEPDSASYKWQCQACDVVGFAYVEDILTQQMLDAKQKAEEPEPEVLIQVGNQTFIKIPDGVLNIKFIGAVFFSNQYLTIGVSDKNSEPVVVNEPDAEYAAIKKLFGG